MRKSEQQRFELLKQLISNDDELSAQEIIILLGISKNIFYRQIELLQEDLRVVFGPDQVTLHNYKTRYSIKNDASLNLSFIIDSMRLYYIKVSQQFSILNAVLYKYYSSVESLTQELNLSASHTYKNLKLLNTVLEPFNVKIAFPSVNGYFNIDGAEPNIRLALYTIYWTIFKGIEWPFKKKPNAYFRELPFPIKHDLLSPSQLARLEYLQVITYWRITYRSQLLMIPDNFKDYLLFFEANSPTTFDSTIKKKFSSSEDLHREELFFGFITRFFIANIDSEQEITVIAQKAIESQLPLTLLTSDLLNKFISHYQLNMDKDVYAVNYYLLLINIIYLYFLGVDLTGFSGDEENSVTHYRLTSWGFSKAEAELTKFTLDSLANSPELKDRLSPGLISSITKLFYTILRNSEQNTRLPIFIQFSKDSYSHTFIRTTLTKIFGHDTLEFIFDIKKAAVIISDCFEENNTSSDFFYLESPYDAITWHKLILFISIRIYKNENLFRN